MLFYSVFQTFHKKNDSLKSLNPEGPLGSHLCDVILHAILITCQFLFCGTKKVNRRFYRVKKIFLSFLRSIFLFPVFLCSFIIPFTENSVIIPPANFVCGGYTVFTLSVHPSIRVSVCDAVFFLIS